MHVWNLQGDKDHGRSSFGFQSFVLFGHESGKFNFPLKKTDNNIQDILKYVKLMSSWI